jgi:hypothetical protein
MSVCLIGTETLVPFARSAPSYIPGGGWGIVFRMRERNACTRLWAALTVPLLLMASAGAGSDGRGADNLPVCGTPTDRCDGPAKRFAPYELPLRLPARLSANVPYRSAPFYAILLKRDRDPACDGGEFTKATETFRKQAQARFPDRKVFADHQCPDLGAVAYQRDGQPSAVALVAVYAGTTEAEAAKIRAKARPFYPGAEYHQMRVLFERIVQ